jgi:hypothetical protein
VTSAEYIVCRALSTVSGCPGVTNPLRQTVTATRIDSCIRPGMTHGRTDMHEQPAPSEKILVVGPGGAGKTFAVNRLRYLGVNAFDADTVPGLLRFLDQAGHDVPFPDVVDAAWFATHQVVWDLGVLRRLLAEHNPVYLFGLSGNAFAFHHLFDRAYCLRANAALVEQRLLDPSRRNPAGKTEEQWRLLLGSLDALYRRAEELGFSMIDASHSPEEIYARISGSAC